MFVRLGRALNTGLVDSFAGFSPDAPAKPPRSASDAAPTRVPAGR